MLFLIINAYVALMMYCGYRANVADVYESVVAEVLQMIGKDLRNLTVKIVRLGGTATASGKAIFELGVVWRTGGMADTREELP